MNNEYKYSILDLQNKTGFSMSLLRKILAEIQPVIPDTFIKGDKNALFFNENGLIIIDQVKQMKDSGMNLPSIKKSLENTRAVKTNYTVKTDNNTNQNNNIITNYINDLIKEIKESNERTLKIKNEVLQAKDEVIKSKEHIISELNQKILLLTSGREIEEVQKEYENNRIELLKLKEKTIEQEYKNREIINKSELLNNELINKDSKIEEFKQKLIEKENKVNQLKNLQIQLNSSIQELNVLDSKWFVSKQKKEIKDRIFKINNEIDLLI